MIAVDLAYTQSDQRRYNGVYMLTGDKYENLLGSHDVQQHYPRMRKRFFGKVAQTGCACEHRDRFMVRRKEEDINDLWFDCYEIQ